MSLEERANTLDEKLKHNPIDQNVEALIIGARRQRRATRLLTISIILEFLLIGGLAVVSYRTTQLTQLAQNNKDAVLLNCETANDSRSNQRTLWGYVLSLTPIQPRTTEQQARVEEFSKFVDKTFAQRDCEAEARQTNE